MSTTYRSTVSVYGDELYVLWTGSVWVSPCNGQEHSRDTDAMRCELQAYYCACGSDVESPEVAAEIDGYLQNMTVED